jgi:hypothetical protein
MFDRPFELVIVVMGSGLIYVYEGARLGKDSYPDDNVWYFAILGEVTDYSGAVIKTSLLKSAYRRGLLESKEFYKLRRG